MELAVGEFVRLKEIDPILFGNSLMRRES